MGREPTFDLVVACTPQNAVAFWVRSTYHDAPRDTWKGFKRFFCYAGAVGTIAMGTNAAAYREWLGVPRENLSRRMQPTARIVLSAQARGYSTARTSARGE